MWKRNYNIQSFIWWKNLIGLIKIHLSHESSTEPEAPFNIKELKSTAGAAEILNIFM